MTTVTIPTEPALTGFNWEIPKSYNFWLETLERRPSGNKVYIVTSNSVIFDNPEDAELFKTTFGL